MSNITIDLESYFVQRTIRRFPIELKSILAKIYDDFNKGNVEKKVEADFGSNFAYSNIAIIPENSEGHCHCK